MALAPAASATETPIGKMHHPFGDESVTTAPTRMLRRPVGLPETTSTVAEAEAGVALRRTYRRQGGGNGTIAAVAGKTPRPLVETSVVMVGR